MKNRKCFITGIKGSRLTKQELIFLKRYKPWGIILFSRNLQNIKQIKNLTSNIKNIFKDQNYPILIDQEGGRVNRLSKIISLDKFTSEYFGKLFIKNRKEFKITYKLFIDKISYLLKNLGINIKIVSDIGDLCIKYFRDNSIGTVIKHIPGHGLAKVDSHHFTPIINKNISYLYKKDFKAFVAKKTLFAMTAHVIFKKIDPVNTVTHSKKMINIIRNKIKFKNSDNSTFFGYEEIN